MSSSKHIPRLLTELDPVSGHAVGESRSLTDFLDHKAVIVLGDPGLGKSEELRICASALDGNLIPVQGLLSRDPARLRGKRLFLDGLDEARSAEANKIGVIQKVIAKLEDAHRPQFVLSCRSLDWYGRPDLRSIGDSYGTGSLVVLRLEPLTIAQATEIVAQKHDDAGSFVREAVERGLDDYLGNPNDLSLLLSIGGGGWPEGRKDLFEKSARVLARELNEVHAISCKRRND